MRCLKCSTEFDEEHISVLCVRYPYIVPEHPARYGIFRLHVETAMPIG